MEKEVDYSLKKIKECANNESVFNYVRGLFDIKDKEGNRKFKFGDFVHLKTELEKISESNKKNFYCLALLLDIEIENKKSENCKEIFDKLIEADFIRRKYWQCRKQNF